MEILQQTSIACDYGPSEKCSSGLAGNCINPVKDSNEYDNPEFVTSKCFGAKALIAQVLDAHK